jgi:hypothetical protein
MPFMGLTTEEARALELEVVSRQARLKLTRLIRSRCNGGEPRIELIRKNGFINTANAVLGKAIYRLESDDWGEYEPAEYAWHNGELELIMRIPSTPQLAEILADYLQSGLLDASDVNDILRSDNCSFSYQTRRLDEEVELIVSSPDEIEDAGFESEHPNVRKLVARMDHALDAKDAPAVLHAAASIIETLAKDVLQNPGVENQSLVLLC